MACAPPSCGMCLPLPEALLALPLLPRGERRPRGAADGSAARPAQRVRPPLPSRTNEPDD
eukprot:221175-Prymnesium_polylepis.1